VGCAPAGFPCAVELLGSGPAGGPAHLQAALCLHKPRPRNLTGMATVQIGLPCCTPPRVPCMQLAQVRSGVQPQHIHCRQMRRHHSNPVADGGSFRGVAPIQPLRRGRGCVPTHVPSRLQSDSEAVRADAKFGCGHTWKSAFNKALGRQANNSIPERVEAVKPSLPALLGPGRLLLGSVERGWGQHAAPAAKRGRTVSRPPEGGAHCPGADSRPAAGCAYEVVVGFAVDVEIDDSQGAAGIPPRRPGRMKPWDVPLWKIRGSWGQSLTRPHRLGGSCRYPARTKSDRSRRLLGCGCGGEAAGLAVVQDVEDDLEQVAAGGDLRDVAEPQVGRLSTRARFHDDDYPSERPSAPR
jgi:hypothetical protein